MSLAEALLRTPDPKRADQLIAERLAAIRSAGVTAGATECSACRIQMEQGTSKPTVHPVKLLAKAYGLLPGPAPDGLDEILMTTSGPLTTMALPPGWVVMAPWKMR